MHTYHGKEMDNEALKSDLPTNQEKKYNEFGKPVRRGQDIGMDHLRCLPIVYTRHQKMANIEALWATKVVFLMIGLGASSISNSWKAFAQNVKSIEEYQHLVDNGILHVYFEHLLPMKTQWQHILNLMCRFEPHGG